MIKSLLLYLAFAVSIGGFCQPPPLKVYDIKKKRLLVKITGVYIYSINQGNIDIDSAMVLACSANKIPISLSYDEGYNDGKYLLESEMVDNNNITAALKILSKSQKTDRIKLLLQLGSHYLFKPGSKKEDLQNALLYIKQAVELSNQLKIQKWQQQSNMLLGKYYFQAGNMTESLAIFSAVTKNCRKLNNKKALAEAIENQGTYLLDNNPEKEKLLTEAMLLYKETGEKEKEAETLMKLVTVHFWTGNLPLAKKESIQAYNFLKKIGFRHTHYNASTISYVDIVVKNPKEALFYAFDAVKTMEATKDYIMAENFYMRLGNVYAQMGHFEEAIPLLKKSIEMGQKDPSNRSWYKSFISYITVLSELGRYKEALDYLKKTTDKYPPDNILDKIFLANNTAICYVRTGNIKLAEQNFQIVEKYAPQIINPQTALSTSNIYSDMSLFYAKIGNGSKAKLFTDKATEIKHKYNLRSGYPILDLSLFKIDSLSGKYLSAIAHYQKYKKGNDSLVNYSQSKEIEELRFKYETAKKEQNIKSLQTQTKLQEGKLKESKLLIKLSIGSLLLLLIIIGLLYNLYRVKQKNNKKLEIKEKEISLKNTNLQHLLDEKEWLMKEIHHRVKNNLQTVISLLNSQSAYVDNDMARSTIKSSQHRIHAMSLIHQKLYMSENISTINMPIYIKELVEYLKDSFQLKQRVRFEIDIEQLELDVVQAVPLGLIINEAVTNSIKYAFPNDQDGLISITLVSTDANHYLLSIQDNGIGIPVTFKEKTNSFGMSLIKGLSDDLEGTFSIENNNGTLLKLNFEKIILDKQNKKI
ncbi:MAG TPA: histidine kinase dimerization/phosphoacceptor domain -containing protein [Flavobacterium sp.]|uniref:histidine kinase dimerization/phosphoacceptor domain -containing protein n=1 Tax=Flavobacterium sp. TaxID=239 RepID=UPI002DB7E69F|nr:histidine kinase dimerization/phosphoacceptor domain -containing protein [Flavobacterium sp.]HEU4789113.1 histidine kinase dimerization/phosphoacceptor domain -containing protein [Flavobacterium sp.]